MRILLIFTCLVVTYFAFAQQTDSVHVSGTKSAKWSKLDSMNKKTSFRIDSAQLLINKPLDINGKNLLKYVRRKKIGVTVDSLENDDDSLRVTSNPDTTKLEKAEAIATSVKEKATRPVKMDGANMLMLNVIRAKVTTRYASRRKHVKDSIANDPGDTINMDSTMAEKNVNLQHTQKIVSHAKELSISRADDITLPDSLLPTVMHNSFNKVQPLVKQSEKEVTQQLDKPLDKITSKSNHALNSLSKETMGKGDFPSDINLRQINLPNTSNELPQSEIKGGLQLPDQLLEKVQGQSSAKKITDLKVIDTKMTFDNPLQEKITDGLERVDLDRKVSQVTKAEELKKLKNTGDKLNSVTDKAQGYNRDVQNVKEGNLEKAETIKNDLLNEAPSSIKDAQVKLDGLKSEQDKLNALKNKEEFKKQTLIRARESVVQLLATQQSEVMKPVVKISSYQKTGATIFNTAKDLPPRPLKSKRPPLIERFIPGMTLQVQKGQYWLMDMNPSLRFRVKSILSSGLGWNYRVVIDQSGRYRREEYIAGFRSFTELSVRKGLSVRADVERMSAYVPILFQQPDQKQRMEIWSFMIGFRKDFSLGKNVLSNVQFMYNIYDPDKKSPYLNRLNVRFGFEFPFKKKSFQRQKNETGK